MMWKTWALRHIEGGAGRTLLSSGSMTKTGRFTLTQLIIVVEINISWSAHEEKHLRSWALIKFFFQRNLALLYRHLDRLWGFPCCLRFQEIPPAFSVGVLSEPFSPFFNPSLRAWWAISASACWAVFDFRFNTISLPASPSFTSTPSLFRPSSCFPIDSQTKTEPQCVSLFKSRLGFVIFIKLYQYFMYETKDIIKRNEFESNMKAPQLFLLTK